MSIDSVKRAYKSFSQEETILFYTDEEVYDLVDALARYIIGEASKSSTPASQIPEGYIRILECQKKIGFIAEDFIYKACKQKAFQEKCCTLVGRKWYVHPQKAKDYFYETSKVFRNRLDRINSMKK